MFNFIRNAFLKEDSEHLRFVKKLVGQPSIKIDYFGSWYQITLDFYPQPVQVEIEYNTVWETYRGRVWSLQPRYEYIYYSLDSSAIQYLLRTTEARKLLEQRILDAYNIQQQRNSDVEKLKQGILNS